MGISNVPASEVHSPRRHYDVMEQLRVDTRFQHLAGRINDQDQKIRELQRDRDNMSACACISACLFTGLVLGLHTLSEHVNALWKNQSR